jgi:hypothetical protein
MFVKALPAPAALRCSGTITSAAACLPAAASRWLIIVCLVKESNGTNMHSTVRPARHPHESKCSCHRQALLNTHCKLLLMSLVPCIALNTLCVLGCGCLQECSVWAESGECVVNPTFMVGDKNSPGNCLASCGRCDLLPDPTKTNGSSRKLKQ